MNVVCAAVQTGDVWAAFGVERKGSLQHHITAFSFVDDLPRHQGLFVREVIWYDGLTIDKGTKDCVQEDPPAHHSSNGYIYCNARVP